MTGFFIIPLLPFASIGQIYEWVDKNRGIHHSSEPHPDSVAMFTQTDEIQTDEAVLKQQEERDRQAAGKLPQQQSGSKAPPEQAENKATDETAPDEEAAEDQEREAFHRQRIKQRTVKNTSPAVSLLEQRESSRL